MMLKLSHLVYPIHKACTLRFTPEYPMELREDVAYSVSIYPASGLRLYGLRNRKAGPTAADCAFFDRPGHHQPLKLRDGALEITITFPQEDWYRLRIYAGDVYLETQELYALEDDLLTLTPFKGDNHMHTYLSDGKDSPMYMAAAACRHGYDYCVITDHKQYGPSLMARDFYAGTGVDFLVIPGEEVHSPDNRVHIINLGGSASVNDWWRDHEDEYRAAVARELETMTEPMAQECRYEAAACQVMFDKIRSVDGVSVLCHPHWFIENGFNEREDVTEYLWDHRRFDALELIAGGAFEMGTQLQLSYFKDRESMPILGSSDAHACFGGRLEPGNYTIAFAESLDAASVKNAIRQGLTVAGSAGKLYGAYRLVKYAYFLLQCYYPAHDAQRATLGSRMLRLASSQQGPDSALAQNLDTPRPSEGFALLRYPEDR